MLFTLTRRVIGAWAWFVGHHLPAPVLPGVAAVTAQVYADLYDDVASALDALDDRPSASAGQSTRLAGYWPDGFDPIRDAVSENLL